MDRDSNISKLFEIALWIGVGALLVYVLTKREKTTTTTMQPQFQEPRESYESQYTGLLDWKPLDNIPRVPDLSPVYIQQSTPVQQDVMKEIQELRQQIYQMQQNYQQQPANAVYVQPLTQQPVTSYKNNERYIAKRNKDNFIEDLNVIRDAKTNV